MKKQILALVMVLVILMSCVIMTGAANGGSVGAADQTIAPGDEVTLTIALSGCDAAKSGGVTVTYDSDFEYVSGGWAFASSPMMSSFNTPVAGVGVFTYSGDTNINGNIFVLKLRAKDTASGDYTVGYDFTFRNAASADFAASGSTKITVGEPHVHTWDKGVITKEPTKSEDGNHRYSCTGCSGTKDVPIPYFVDCEILSYQTTPVKDGLFDVRIVAGVNSLETSFIGFEVGVFDSVGTAVSGVTVSTTTIAYETIMAGNTPCAASDFGYQYLVLLTIRNIDRSYIDRDIAVRPFTERGGDTHYGNTIVFGYDGETDPVTSFPVFSISKTNLFA